MNLTNPQRARKLAGGLICHPQYLPRYLSQNLISRRSPIELGLPWFSYGAIDFLSDFLRPEMTVFEFGSGGSTIFFASRCASVVSVEDSESWSRSVRERLVRDGLRNATIRACPFDFDRTLGFEQSDYLAQVREDSYDVIVVDGADNDYKIRPICFRAAEDQIKPGGIIVVDDSWRYQELREENRADRFSVFETVGPARFGVTSTDIYFY